MSLVNRLTVCAAVVALALAAPVFAPTAPAQEGGLETQLDNGQGAGAGAGGGLETQPGQQGQGQGQGGQQANVENTQYEDWTLQCRKQGTQTGPCRMVQRVRNEQANRDMMAVIVANPPQGAPFVNFIVPLGVNLQAPLPISVDGSQVGQAAYLTCTQEGCVARLQVNDQALTAMKQGRQLQIQLTSLRGQQQQLSASLLGFTDAYNAMGS